MRWNWQIKTRLLIVLAGTIALFGGFGFAFVQRTDPKGPFLLLANVVQPMPAIAVLLGISAVCAVAAGLLLHRDLPYAAALVIGAGWMSLALRSPSISQALIFIPVDSTKGVQAFYLRLLLELAVLTGVSLLAYLLAEGAARLVSPAGAGGEGNVQLGGSWTDLGADFLGTAVLGTQFYFLLVDNSHLRGQVIFALAAGSFLAAMASHQLFPSRSPWGLLAGAGAAAAACYLWAAFGGTDARIFGYQAPGKLGRPMPVDFLGAAVPAVMAAYLISLRLVHARNEAGSNQQSAVS